MLRKIRTSYLFQAFVLNFILALFALGWVMLTQKGLFSVSADFNHQQIPFAMHAGNMIKNGSVGWDWSLDLGSGFIGGYSFYVIGNPSFWISMLFPADMFMYVVGWLYILKYAFAGMTAALWMGQFVKDKRCAVLASVMYAFSGFMSTNLLFYHFHDVVLWFPVLLYTFDLLIKEKRHVFIPAVLINAITCYFFFVGEVVFLIAYYIFRYVIEDKKTLRMFPIILVDGVLGVGLGAAILLPSAYFTMQNPRVKVDYYGHNSLVFVEKYYLYILKGLVFPGENQSSQSSVMQQNYTSCAAYIPLTGLIFVIAYVKEHKNWLTRMLKWCVVMACIPVLNAVFSLFASIYFRWYYMPTLLFALCGALVIEKREEYSESISQACFIWGCITVGFIVFVRFVPWDEGEYLLFREALFWTLSCIAITGIVCTWSSMQNKSLCLFGIYLCVFAVLTTAMTLHLYQQDDDSATKVKARLETTAKLPDPWPYRYHSRFNEDTLAHNHMSMANFSSTVSGAIFRFYNSLGLERDMKSPPAIPGMRELLSAKYTITTSDMGEAVDEEYSKDLGYTLRVYEEEVPPIGYAYETYMTASEFANISPGLRAVAMLETLVIPDEKGQEISKVLEHCIPENLTTDSEYISNLAKKRSQDSVKNPKHSSGGYESVYVADKDKYLFLSIPHDEGWRAYVDGNETEIVDINGLMAVPVKKGKNIIMLQYTTPLLKEGLFVSLNSFVACIIWFFINLALENRNTICLFGRGRFWIR